MSAEENEAIDKLLDPDASAAQQRATLRWFAEYLEQGYILNLRPSRAIMNALEDFADMPQVAAALKTRAKNLQTKYKIR